MSSQQMEGTPDFAYKFGAGRYIQQPGAVALVGVEAARIGTKAYLLAGETSAAIAGDAVRASLRAAGVPHAFAVWVGACSQEQAEATARAARAQGCDVVIGLGGGRILDLAKLAARIAGLPVMTAPTSSATCAAYTPLSLVYTPEGRVRGTWYFEADVRAVLVDMDIVGRQGTRLLAAGIVDALAKWVEIRHHLAAQQAAGDEGFATAALLARHAYDRLMAQADAAFADMRAGIVSPVVCNAAFLSIVTAGMVSGSARGQFQSALAHAIYEWTRTDCLHEAAPWLHGEIVGVGLFAQAAYGGDDDIARDLHALMRRMGMPTTFAGIGIDLTAARRDVLADALCATRFIPDLPGERTRVLEALEACR